MTMKCIPVPLNTKKLMLGQASWKDPAGTVHFAIGERAVDSDRGTFLTYTACGQFDVPANAAITGVVEGRLVAPDAVTCTVCAMQGNGIGKTGDGFAGRLNQYVCRTCGHTLTTVDLVNGVTPFLIGCYGNGPCVGTSSIRSKSGRDLAESKFYCNIPEDAEPTHEWYRPQTLDSLTEAERQHVAGGGLLLRPISPGGTHP